MGACRAKISVSGKRDSDPRPQPWQGCALPKEIQGKAKGLFYHYKDRS